MFVTLAVASAPTGFGSGGFDGSVVGSVGAAAVACVVGAATGSAGAGAVAVAVGFAESSVLVACATGLSSAFLSSLFLPPKIFLTAPLTLSIGAFTLRCQHRFRLGSQRCERDCRDTVKALKRSICSGMCK